MDEICIHLADPTLTIALFPRKLDTFVIASPVLKFFSVDAFTVSVTYFLSACISRKIATGTSY